MPLGAPQASRDRRTDATLRPRRRVVLLALLALPASAGTAAARAGRDADDCGTDTADTDCQQQSDQSGKDKGQSK